MNLLRFASRSFWSELPVCSSSAAPSGWGLSLKITAPSTCLNPFKTSCFSFSCPLWSPSLPGLRTDPPSWFSLSFWMSLWSMSDHLVVAALLWWHHFHGSGIFFFFFILPWSVFLHYLLMFWVKRSLVFMMSKHRRGVGLQVLIVEVVRSGASLDTWTVRRRIWRYWSGLHVFLL